MSRYSDADAGGANERSEDARDLAYLAAEKSIPAAYVLWFFFGLLGAHRFYLGRSKTGLIMLLLSLSVIGLLATVIWFVVDAFLIPGMTEERNDELYFLLSN